MYDRFNWQTELIPKPLSCPHFFAMAANIVAMEAFPLLF